MRRPQLEAMAAAVPQRRNIIWPLTEPVASSAAVREPVSSEGAVQAVAVMPARSDAERTALVPRTGEAVTC